MTCIELGLLLLGFFVLHFPSLGDLTSKNCNIGSCALLHIDSQLNAGVDLILGVNGMIWISAEAQGGKEGKGRESTRQQIESIARVANAIRALAKLNFRITAARLSRVVKVMSCPIQPSKILAGLGVLN